MEFSRTLKEEIIKKIGKEFLETFGKRINILERRGYTLKNIPNLIKHNSILKEYLEIEESLNLSPKLKILLINLFNEIEKEKGEQNNLKINFTFSKYSKEIMAYLEKYLNFLCLGFPGLIKEESKNENYKLVHFFDLKIKYKTELLTFFPYSEIKIFQKEEKFVIFARKDHPASKLKRVKDVEQMLIEVGNPPILVGG